MISVRFQGKPLNIMAIQAYAPTSNAEETAPYRFDKDNVQDGLGYLLSESKKLIKDKLSQSPETHVNKKTCVYNHKTIECFPLASFPHTSRAPV